MKQIGYYTSCAECCGMEEYVGVSREDFDPETEILYIKKVATTGEKQMYGGLYRVKPAHIFFTDIDENWNFDGGKKFAKYIKINKLGAIKTNAAAYNKNSGNNVKAWLWTPNWTNIENFSIKKKK